MARLDRRVAGLSAALFGCIAAAAWSGSREDSLDALAKRDRASASPHAGHASSIVAAPTRAAISAPSTPAPAPAGAVDRGSLPFDLGAVIDRVHFAYRPDDAPGRFEAGHATYSVEVDARSVKLVPYHAERAPDAIDPVEDPATRDATRDDPHLIEGAPLRLETSRIARGGDVLADVRGGDARVEDDGHLAIARGPVVETYRNRDEGVEQSWTFDAKPAGEGDLVVAVRPSGLRFEGETASGLHFADARTGLGFRYGHGTWIDARGVETHVAARYAGGRIELVVPARVLEGSSYPAVLDPTISPEVRIDEPVTPAASGDRNRPSVASNGTDYLVVWQDTRSGNYPDIYGARVGSDGVVRDPAGFALSTAGGSQYRPRVASNGTDYLVVWQDGRGPTVDIYGTRVTSAGAVSHPSGLPLSTAANDQNAPTVASNGADYFVVWTDARAGWTNFDVYGTRVTSDGVVSDPDGLAISAAANHESSPSVASNGTDYFVVWGDARAGTTNYDVYGARVTSAGEVSDPSGLALSTEVNHQSYASVASNGTDYFVVWEDARADPDERDLYGTRVTSAGEVSDPNGLALATTASDETAASVASDGTDYLVVWHELRAGPSFDVYGTRVTSAGEVGDPSGLAVSTDGSHQNFPMVASNGTEYLVVWEDRRTPAYDVYGARVTSAGLVRDPDGLPICAVTTSMWRSSVASNGTDYLFVFHDERIGLGFDVYGALVTSAGVVGAPILLTDAAYAQANASVASNGTDFLVVWEDLRNGNPDVYGTRVTSAGVVGDPNGLAISTTPSGESKPIVASNGGDYLVVWEDLRNDATSSVDLYGTRVTSAGEVSDASGLALSTAADAQGNASVASNGADYLVVWEDFRSGQSFDVYGTRVTSAGEVSDTSGLALSTAANDQTEPSVASDGSDYLVVWSDYRTVSQYGHNGDIFCTFVTSAGDVSDPSGLAIAEAFHIQKSPSVAWNGAEYLVVWNDYRNNAPFPYVYGTRVRSGVLDSPSGRFLTYGSGEHGPPGLAAGPDGSFVFVVERGNYAVHTTHARFVRFGADPGVSCVENAECESTFCVDGVCCASACAGGTSDCKACSIAAGAPSDGTCAPLTGASCSDGDSCTVGDTCNAGTCEAGAYPCGATWCAAGAGESFECGPCAFGTYSADGTGATGCTPCAPGTYSSSEGATACTVCTVCGEGTIEIAPCWDMADTVCGPAPPQEDGGSADAGSTDGGSTGGAAPDGGTCAVAGGAVAGGPSPLAWLACTALTALALSRMRRRSASCAGASSLRA